MRVISAFFAIRRRSSHGILPYGSAYSSIVGQPAFAIFTMDTPRISFKKYWREHSENVRSYNPAKPHQTDSKASPPVVAGPVYRHCPFYCLGVCTTARLDEAEPPVLFLRRFTAASPFLECSLLSCCVKDVKRVCQHDRFRPSHDVHRFQDACRSTFATAARVDG